MSEHWLTVPSSPVPLVLIQVTGVIAHLDIDWCLKGHGSGHARRCSDTQGFVSLMSITQQAVDGTVVIVGI